MIYKKRFAYIICFLVVTMLIGGCAVPQPRGRGTRFFLRDPQSSRAYFVYLPVGYSADQVWPLVLTLHGMKPFDHAESQELEWENLADRHKLVVLAPDIHNSDLLMEYPMRNVTTSVLADEKVVVRILSYLIERCNIDQTKIYATSWSSGGYLLHYLAANNPNMFAAISARGSCFSLDLMEKVPKWKIERLAERKPPVMIYYGSNDFGGVRRESAQAIQWYKSLNIPISNDVVEGRGHERVPDLAANFFVRHGATARPTESVEIVASYERGIAPFWVNFRADLPGVNRRDYGNYRFAWFINGALQGTEPTLFVTLYKPGEHTVSVQVTNNSNTKFEASRTVVVLPRQETVRAQ